MQLENPSYKEVASKMPIIGVWDDHDYGTNDGNNKYPHREISQKYFLDFLHEPKDSLRRKQQGVYASYVIGSGEKTIKIFLLDNR
jgi:alkaline phosphatase D